MRPIREIRGDDNPVVGVASPSDVHDWFYDEAFYNGHDIGWDEAVAAFREELEAEGLDPEEIEDRIENAGDYIFEHEAYYLVGDWKQNEDGKWEIDHEGSDGFAVTYAPMDSFGGTICVEWSKWVTACHHTSPCFVMKGTGQPCGDLSTPGDSSLAYSLPAEYYADYKEASNG